MAEINIYQQYFEACGTFNGRERHAVNIILKSDSSEGIIRYDILVSFFPHDDPEDFAVSYDACFTKTIYSGKGRRSKKREAEFMKDIRDMATSLATENGASIDWDKPLCEARMG